MMLRVLDSIVLMVVVAGCMPATAFGQFGVALTGDATVCGSDSYTKTGEGKIGPLEAKGVPCSGNGSTAIAVGIANIGPPRNHAFVKAETTGDIGSSSGSSGWVDTVTFTPPTGFADKRASFKLHDDYYVGVSGPIPEGQIPATYCYQIISLGVNECTNQTGDIELQKIDVHRQFMLEINNAGVFRTQIAVTVGAGAFPGDVLAQVSEAAGSEGIDFTCPTTGWVYTLASMPKTSFMCQVTAQ